MKSKYSKTKQNRKLEAKFFRQFQILHPVGKQAYKLELPKKWRIHNVFYMSLLKQNITRKERAHKNVTEFKAGDSKENKVEAIWDSAVYANKAEGHLPGLYSLVAWKRYLEEENTWEPSSAVQYVKKLINYFHKKYPEKSAATFLPIDSALPMARSTVKPTRPTTIKRKRGQPANSGSKQARNWVLDACDIWTILLL